MTRVKDVAIDLAAALRERIAIVADEESRRDPQRHTHRLREVSEKISELSAQLPAPVDARLKHYLERCSYSKALEFLEASQPNEK
jgi:hypothetical protein